MKIYIAGKIRGNEGYREEFKIVEDMFKGDIVLNPSVLPKGLTNEEYAMIDFAMINSSDMVVFLPNFRESEGAMLEYRYCKYIGKKMMELNKMKDCNTCEDYPKCDGCGTYIHMLVKALENEKTIGGTNIDTFGIFY